MSLKRYKMSKDCTMSNTIEYNELIRIAVDGYNCFFNGYWLLTLTIRIPISTMTVP